MVTEAYIKNSKFYILYNGNYYLLNPYTKSWSITYNTAEDSDYDVTKVARRFMRRWCRKDIRLFR